MTASAHAYHFDLDGTLVEVSVPFERLVTEAAEAAGASDVAPTAFGEALAHHMHDGETPIRTAASQAFPDADADGFRDRFIEAEVAATTPLPGAVTVLRTLRRRYPIGVLTNGIPALQREKLRSTGLLEYVDDVVVSNAIGAGKPDPEIYRIAADRLPAKRRTIVADDYERDLAAAAELGWEPILVGKQLDDRSVRTIETLSALLD